MRMRRAAQVFTLVGLCAAFAAPALVYSGDQPSDDQVARGKYLVTLGGCNDCHSPKKMTDKGPAFDETRLLSGQPAADPIPAVADGAINPAGWMAMCNANMTAWAGPWGVSFASNLTPDKQTGLGEWTAEQFIKALRTGKHRGFGQPILPPMPWQTIGMATDEDLTAIFAYLQSLPAVSNKVPNPIPPAAGK